MQDSQHKVPAEDTRSGAHRSSPRRRRQEKHPPKSYPASAPGESIQSLEKSVALLVREMGRIQQTLARLETRLPKDPADPAPFAPFQKDLQEIKERVFKEAISSSRERQALQSAVESLQSQMLALQQATRLAPRTQHNIPEQNLRVGIFVDVQNIFYAAKQFHARLDFEKLLKVSVGSRRLIRAIAYVVQSPEVDQSGFISMLQQKSYEVRRKDLRQRSDGSAKGDWDMGMAIDIMGLVDTLDVIVLVSGDGDFVSLVNLVKTIGPRVEVISFLHNTARDLIQSADCHIPIEEALLMRPTGNGNHTQSGSAPTQNTGQAPHSESSQTHPET